MSSILLLTVSIALSAAYAAAQVPATPGLVQEQAAKSAVQLVARQSFDPQHSPRMAPVQLRLVNGSSFLVDEARESEQGIWYQLNGVTYLVARERVKSIERSQNTKQVVEPRVSGFNNAGSSEELASIQPVWIYLTGGARVEADSAIESSAGVWYRRGSLTIFIERTRVERVEREDAEIAKQSNPAVKERGWTSGNAKIDSLIKQNGAQHGVDPYLIFCVMEQESHFSSRIVSPKGARGLMQLMPGTSARFGVRHPFNPAENISGGTRYLKQLFDQFNGRVDLVLASYNAGEGAVIKYGHKVPPYRETRDYVKKISYRYRRGG
jgi:hypothetical protein